jgi:hypothetical protein
VLAVLSEVGFRLRIRPAAPGITCATG